MSSRKDIERWDKTFDEAMQCVDFDRIHKVMEFLDWRWAAIDGVPSIYQLITLVQKLYKDFLVDMADHPDDDDIDFMTGTGGFRLYASTYNDGELRYFIEILFNIS